MFITLPHDLGNSTCYLTARFSVLASKLVHACKPCKLRCNGLEIDVVYFGQPMGAVHCICWSKYTFSLLFSTFSPHLGIKKGKMRRMLKAPHLIPWTYLIMPRKCRCKKTFTSKCLSKYDFSEMESADKDLKKE